MNSFRIMRSPCFTGSVNDASSHILVPMVETENTETTVESEKKASGKKGTSKKAKIPRPPNAFILYRQHYHPMVKEEHPEFHNNDICITFLSIHLLSMKLLIDTSYRSGQTMEK
jgi:hypothetical protein